MCEVYNFKVNLEIRKIETIIIEKQNGKEGKGREGNLYGGRKKRLSGKWNNFENREVTIELKSMKRWCRIFERIIFFNLSLWRGLWSNLTDVERYYLKVFVR